MAYCYVKLKRLKEASKYYELAIKYFPYNLELMIDFAFFLESTDIKKAYKSIFFLYKKFMKKFWI